MKSKAAKLSLMEFLHSPATLILWTFTIPIVTLGQIVTSYWYYAENFGFWFYLMVATIVVPSYFNFTHIFGKLLPKDRSPFPNHWQFSIILPRLLSAFVIWMMIALELLGLAIFTQSVIPDVFGMPKTEEAESLIGIATIFGSICIPGMIFYWVFILKGSELSRKSLFSKKYRP